MISYQSRSRGHGRSHNVSQQGLIAVPVPLFSINLLREFDSDAHRNLKILRVCCDRFVTWRTEYVKIGSILLRECRLPSEDGPLRGHYE